MFAGTCKGSKNVILVIVGLALFKIKGKSAVRGRRLVMSAFYFEPRK